MICADRTFEVFCGKDIEASGLDERVRLDVHVLVRHELSAQEKS